ncbi:ABC transporter permease [Rhizobium sp. SL86]|uniref:ABC transporter permease n=1 Tax=Rhizobium sp. SL86 TaxID=2995148 RepID=UPI002276FC07|nr:ABC transporter permease [Rhizobium sp. SL86]MCY1669386.1 ABC transporter permease [Rhizobium sp. SL86]
MTVQNHSSFGKVERKTSYWAALAIQRRVISALMVREALGRFGHENLGFFWIIGEPMLMTSGVMLMWSMSGFEKGHEGVGLIPFALSGYSMLTLWRHITGKSIYALRFSAALLFHRNIRILDMLIARTVLECLGGLAAFFITYLLFNILGYMETLEDPLLVIGAWLLLTWFAFGVSLIIAGLTEMVEPVGHFVQPTLYISLPMTGSFYMLHWLPESVQGILWWSPLVQFFEMFRAGMFGSHVPTEWSVPYLAVWGLLLTSIGLPIVNHAQKHIKLY